MPGVDLHREIQLAREAHILMKEKVVERFRFRPAQDGVHIVQDTIEYALGIAFGNDIISQAPVVGALILERERASLLFAIRNISKTASVNSSSDVMCWSAHWDIC